MRLHGKIALAALIVLGVAIGLLVGSVCFIPNTVVAWPDVATGFLLAATLLGLLLALPRFAPKTALLAFVGASVWVWLITLSRLDDIPLTLAALVGIAIIAVVWRKGCQVSFPLFKP